MNNKILKYRVIYNCIVSFFAVAFLMSLLYLNGNYAPFGDNSLAWADGDIQYLDFFAYYQDILFGKNSLIYTFSKVLGGTNIAVFSYYLASPFNFLVIFFEKKDLHIFFNLLILLKLSLAGGTCAYFLNTRFKEFLGKSKCSNFFIILLSICYALSQYNITQSSNIMWLDGVYILPFILLGIYKIIQGENIWKLSVPIILSILFNWYSGGINCLFSAFWFLLELFLYIKEKPVCKKTKFLFHIFSRYILSMIIGVMCSCILFLPTILALQNSSRGSLQLNMLLDISIIGDLPSVIQKYTYGSVSTYGSVALFCGMLPLIGVIGFFSVKGSIYRKEKIILGCALLISVLFYFWRPFFVVFSLLKDASSYYYRYSYITIFVIIFIAAYFYLMREYCNQISYIKIGLIYSGLLLVLFYLKPEQDRNLVYCSAAIFMIIIILLSYIQQNQIKGNMSKKLLAFLFIVVLFDMSYGARENMINYHTNNVKDYENYVAQESKQIDKLKKYDNFTYRISQTSTRKMSDVNLTAYYNEALTYNYWSISGYTSSPDDIQRNFLDQVGYRINGDNMCIVNTSILGVDSLMGVKYILSKYPINGLKKIPELGEYNKKSVYSNPYALPFAFTYVPKGINNNDTENPFDEQNNLYSELLGRKVVLYEPLEYTVVQKGDVSSDFSQKYKLSIPNGNYAVYGNLPWNSEINGILTVNNEYKTAYSCWLSPSVFYIPTKQNDSSATVDLYSTISYDMKENAEQFYGLNLDTLKEITNYLNANVADFYKVDNGNIYIKTRADKNESLYLSVPYDKGWSVILNGVEIQPDLFGDCFYSIPLTKGDNIIQMHYTLPGQMIGMVVAILGGVLLIVFTFLEKSFSIREKR